MDEKRFRLFFLVLLGVAALCATIWTVLTTTSGALVGGVVPIVLGAVFTLIWVVLFVLDLTGIWTGHWPHFRGKH